MIRCRVRIHQGAGKTRRALLPQYQVVHRSGKQTLWLAGLEVPNQRTIGLARSKIN